MIFEHLGKDYSEEKMIRLCHAMPKEGTSHKHLIEEVAAEGFVHKEERNGTIEDIIRYIRDGYPVLVNYLNPLSRHGHYAVVDGFDENEQVLIFADPANGNDYTLHWDEFKSLWHDGDNASKGWMLVVGREKIV